MAVKREKLILFHSNRLFIENGYDNTTMRQVAQEAQVSLGLATYHFQSKRRLAVMVIGRYLEYLKGVVMQLVDAKSQPMVSSAAMVRLAIEFFLSHPCKQFYLDCLERDIYTEAIQAQGNQSMKGIMTMYQFGVSEEMMALFDNYVPPAVEKILILEKEKGNFPNTTYDEVPEIVFSVSVDRFLGRDVIRQAVQDGKQVAQEALVAIPKNITSTLFLDEFD
ncbi:MAG: TetR/AcrR family transcriptional regulator [Candidatus Fimivivens sp.]|nr:TetR/AcrR family transcriptional regulator [Candidatus Fimivivens sp.]